MIEIRQLPRLTQADLQALPQLEGEEDPLHTDGVLDLAGLLDIIIDVRRAEILLLLDNRTTDNFYVGNACLLVGRDFNNLDYPYPHAQGPLGEPINSHWTIPYRNSLLFIANMGVLQQWDFNFSAAHMDFFAVEVPGLVDPLPSYGDPRGRGLRGLYRRKHASLDLESEHPGRIQPSSRRIHMTPRPVSLATD